MDYYKIIVNLIALIFITIGVVMIYDARKISKKWFSNNDSNQMAKILKIFGFIISVLGAIVVILKL